LIEDNYSLDQAERLLARLGAHQVSNGEDILRAAELDARRGRVERAVQRYVATAEEFRDDLHVQLGAIVGLTRLGHAREAHQILQYAELKFDIGQSDFADIIREEIGRLNPADSSLRGKPIPAHVQPAARSDGRLTANIYTITFLDLEGKRVYPGGAERYIFDLVEVLRSLGFEPFIYQAGVKSWTRQIRNIPVQALHWENDIYKLSAKFANETARGCVNIYSPFTLAAANLHRPSVGICHGVYWDTAHGTLLHDHIARDVFSSLLHLDKCISVDANSINVVRATRTELAERMDYVPNYVSEEFFRQRKDSGDIIRVLYPRRLYGPRGYWLLANAIPELLDEFPILEFVFLGDSDEAERSHVASMAARFPGKVKHLSVLPREMATHYESADIVVIPTVNSEGTSLSALEALAAGAAVISTNVGGLGNIIIDELNGLLIAPDAVALRDAIARLVLNPRLRKQLQDAAPRTARAFSKQKWSSAWTSLVCKLEQKAGKIARPERNDAPLRIFHPRTDGMLWQAGAEGLPRQRPHHLLSAINHLGGQVSVIEDQRREAPSVSSNGSVEVLGRDTLLYADRTVIFIYYAYQVWALGDIGEAWLKRLKPDERQSFDSTRDEHDLGKSLVWFDLIDDPSLHKNKIYAEAVKLFIEHADIVSTSSRLLYEHYKLQRPDIILVENACWPNDFTPANLLTERQPVSLSDRLAALGVVIEGRVMGYVGAIAPWFDFDLVERLAVRFPADHLLIVGPISSSVVDRAAKLGRLPNVSFIGALDYESLPAIVGALDVALLPFKINSVTNATNPLKLYEYLGAGVPVVATAMREISMIFQDEGHSRYVHVARNAADFCASVARFLERNLKETAEAANAARAFACRNSWSSRAGTLLTAISQHFRDGDQFKCMSDSTQDVVVQALNPHESDRIVPAEVVVRNQFVRAEILSRDASEGDVLRVSKPFFVYRRSFYRLDVRLTTPCDLVPTKGDWYCTISVAGSVIERIAGAVSFDNTRLIAQLELESGLSELTVEFSIGANVGGRRRYKRLGVIVKDWTLVELNGVKASSIWAVRSRRGEIIATEQLAS
jgi:glycosyltransferase involved in cell wall biosynthesis